jgi:ribosomal protein L37AE/L43A
LIINSGIKKQISQILSAYKKVKKESDIEYWVKENDRNCPACGALVDNKALFCKECGLKIRQNAYSKPLNLDAFLKKSETKTSINTTKTSSENRSETNKFTENRTQINYQYKKKNDK